MGTILENTILSSWSIHFFLCPVEPSGRLPLCSLEKKTTAEMEYDKEIKLGMARIE